MKHLTLLLAFALIAVTNTFAGGEREGGDFTYDAISSLRVEAGTFAVDVQAVRGRHVAMEIQDYPDGYTVYHNVSGSSLRVWVESDFPLFSRSHRGKLVFRVPHDVDLAIDNSTGDVSVRGVRSEDLQVETSTGDIELERIERGAYLRSTTGSVRVRQSHGDFDVGSTTGSISLAEIAGDLRLRSTTGRIEIEAVTGQVRLKTSTGRQIGRRVTLTGDSSFESSTGHIEIDLTNELDALEFDLSSTTGSLRVDDDRSQRRLFLAGTGITVKGSTSTGSQHFY